MVFIFCGDDFNHLEYAAAFFLLADSLKDAINVCLRNLNDLQLGIAIARVYEGDDGPVLQQVIHEHVLPQAAREGDRWLASWAFWMLGERGKSVQALIVLSLRAKLTAVTARWIDPGLHP
jgi:hypothetical protein